MNLYKLVRLRQLLGQVYFSHEQRGFIAGMPQLVGNEWKGDNLLSPPWKIGDGQKIKKLVKYIRGSLLELQGEFCIYCGLPFGETSGNQVEHIAPKGAGRYSQFTFEPLNLALSCSLCNGFEKKERRQYWDTVDALNVAYPSCSFRIVHPYFDNPENELDLNYQDKKVLIKAKTAKGQRTIDTFILDGEHLTSARGRIVRLEELELKEQAAEKLAQDTMNYSVNG